VWKEYFERDDDGAVHGWYGCVVVWGVGWLSWGQFGVLVSTLRASQLRHRGNPLGHMGGLRRQYFGQIDSFQRPTLREGLHKGDILSPLRPFQSL